MKATLVFRFWAEGTGHWGGGMAGSCATRATALMALAVVSGAAPASAAPLSWTRYEGLCDASAAVALDDKHFVVGDDEIDGLNIYEIGTSNTKGSLDLAPFLDIRPELDEEADIEGAARIGNRIYWITSHGRDNDGVEWSSRWRLFATDIGENRVLQPIGTAYRGLLFDLIAEEKLRSLGLEQAARHGPEAEGGLSIEGLAAGQDGTLWIGLRNPRPGEKAILIQLGNPAGLMAGSERAKIGNVARLDLGNRGIRSIEYIDDAYWILAGPHGDTTAATGGDFTLFRWQPEGGADILTQVEIPPLGKTTPEALFATADGKSLVLLSDDGDVKVDGKKCKKLGAIAKKSFRGTLLPMPSP